MKRMSGCNSTVINWGSGVLLQRRYWVLQHWWERPLGASPQQLLEQLRPEFKVLFRVFIDQQWLNQMRLNHLLSRIPHGRDLHAEQPLWMMWTMSSKREISESQTHLIIARAPDVKEIAGTAGAFAAVKGDGSVVCWGDADYGGKQREP